MSRGTILIVEDEAIIALDLERTVEGLGYTVVGRAASGERAVELAAATDPDLILMDVMLQGRMDGISAAELVHSKQETRVVFLTAQGRVERLQRSRLFARSGCVHKPFGRDDLEAAIQGALENVPGGSAGVGGSDRTSA